MIPRLDEITVKSTGWVLLFVLLVVFLTVVRAGTVLLSIHSSDTSAEIIPEKPKTTKVIPEKGDSDTQAAVSEISAPESQADPGSLASLVRNDTLLYFSIDDVSGYLADIRQSDLMSIWNMDGVQEALKGTRDQFRNSWTGFITRYQSPVETVFAGLGERVGGLEVALTEFSFFRGNYTVRIASKCEIKGEPASFIQQFRTNAQNLMPSTKYKDIEVFSGGNEHGILSVFFVDSAMYVTSGKGVEKFIINQLTEPSSQVVPLSKYKEFIKASAEAEEKGGSFLFTVPDFLTKAVGRNLKDITGPVSVYSHLEDGRIKETISLAFSVRHLAEDKPCDFPGGISEKNVLSLRGRPRKQLLELLGTLTLKPMQKNFKLTVRKDINGCFWDYLYHLEDFTDRNIAGYIRWDDSIPIPAWYFVVKITKPNEFQRWIQKVHSAYPPNSATRPDRQTVNILSLKRKIYPFGSFCYIFDNDMLYCSYSAQPLRKIKLGGAPAPLKQDKSAFECVIDFSEIANFIESLNLKGLVKTDLIDLSGLTDLKKIGRSLDTVTLSFEMNQTGVRILSHSVTGVTGIIPAISVIDRLCGIIKE